VDDLAAALLHVLDRDLAEPAAVRRLAAAFGIEHGVREPRPRPAAFVAGCYHFDVELAQSWIAFVGGHTTVVGHGGRAYCVRRRGRRQKPPPR
jgi:hypothetical protein